jgi:hypothetical protein
MNVRLGRYVVALGLAAALGGCCGSSHPTLTTRGTKPGSGDAEAGRVAVSDLLANLDRTRAAGHICLSAAAVRRSAGNSFHSVRAELRRAAGVARSLVKARVKGIATAAERGIAQAKRHPHQTITGGAPGFAKAAALAERYGLSSC